MYTWSQTCKQCGERKTGKHHSRCKACMAAYAREYRAKNRERVREYQKNYQRGRRVDKYGIKRADFDALYECQQGACAICGLVPTPDEKPLFVDHDHASGKVRGLLCQHCNFGLGQFRDDPNLLHKAVAYLLERGD